jgi:hypothetical protein
MASGIRKSKDDRTPYWVQAVFILAFRNTGDVLANLLYYKGLPNAEDDFRP